MGLDFVNVPRPRARLIPWMFVISLCAALMQLCHGVNGITGVSVHGSNRTPVCHGSTLNFSCSGTGLQLEMHSPGVLDGSNAFRFIAIESVGRQVMKGGSVAILVARDSVSSTVATMTVNMTLQLPEFTSSGNYSVFCNITTLSGIEEFDCSNFTVIGGIPTSPPAPIMLSTNSTLLNAIVILSWSNVSEADNYTLYITPSPLQPSHDVAIFTVTTTFFSLTIPYNEQYDVMISASNCAGTSSPSPPLQVLVGGCDQPTSPRNGSLNNYPSVEVGAIVSYQCDDGYIPQEQRVATCLMNLTWSPNPSDHQCTRGCGMPALSPGVAIVSSSGTNIGAVLVFQCMDGLLPTELIKAECAIDGEWSPDPAQHTCSSASSVTSVPTAPMNGGLSGGLVAAIAIVILLLLFVSVLSGALLVILVMKKRHHSSHSSDDDSKPAPIYDEVERSSSASKGSQRDTKAGQATEDVNLQKNMAYGDLRMVQVVS